MCEEQHGPLQHQRFQVKPLKTLPQTIMWPTEVTRCEVSGKGSQDCLVCRWPRVSVAPPHHVDRWLCTVDIDYVPALLWFLVLVLLSSSDNDISSLLCFFCHSLISVWVRSIFCVQVKSPCFLTFLSLCQVWMFESVLLVYKWWLCLCMCVHVLRTTFRPLNDLCPPPPPNPWVCLIRY